MTDLVLGLVVVLLFIQYPLAPADGSSIHPALDLVRLAGCRQCFSLTSFQYQPPATSQTAVFFSHNKSAPATSQPNEALV
jgi:hypothetical protein